MEIISHSPQGMKKSEVKAISYLESLRDSWKGYASFLAKDRQGDMEIDLLIFTHSRILLVEIKEWSGEIRSDGKYWIQTYNERLIKKHPAPTHIKREHAQRLQQLFKTELEHKWGCYYQVEHVVVLSGTAKILNLAPQEKNVVFTIDEFLKIKEKAFFENVFSKKETYDNLFATGFKKRPNDVEQIKIFEDWLFGYSTNISPRLLEVEGYKFDKDKDVIFQHPKGIYSEIEGRSVDNINDLALMRLWDFVPLGALAITNEQRANIALRESKLIKYIDSIDRQFKKDYLLESIKNNTESSISEEVVELYNISQSFIKVSDYLLECDDEQKYELIRAILAPLAKLHFLRISHRDLSLDKLWWDRSTQHVLFSAFATSKFPDELSLKSVSDVRNLLASNGILLPEDIYLGNSDLSIENSYRVDVFQLGVLIYYILFGKYPAKNDENIFENDLIVGTNFYNFMAKCLALDSKDRFKDAEEVLEQFNELTLKKTEIKKEDYSFLLEDLNQFITINIPYQKYMASSGFINDSVKNQSMYYTFIDDKKYIVKIWNSIRITEDPESKGSYRRYLDFAKKVELCKKSHLPIGKIYDFGFSPIGMYIVYEFLEGTVLDEWCEDKDLSIRVDIGLQIIHTINLMHNTGIWHGDIKPENIVIDNCDKVFFIDVLDIGLDGTPVTTSLYIPKQYDNNFQIDNYAIYIVVQDLLSDCKEGLQLLYKNDLGVRQDEAPLDLENLKSTISSFLIKKDELPEFSLPKSIFDVALTNDNDISFNGDLGEYFLSVNKKNHDETIRIYITGKDKKLTIKGMVKDNELIIQQTYIQKITPGEWLQSSKSANNKHNKRVMVVRMAFKIQDGIESKLSDDFIQFISIQNCIAHHLGGEGQKNIEDGISGDITNNKYKIQTLWSLILQSEKNILPVVTTLSSANKLSERGKYYIEIAEDISDYQIDSSDNVAILSDDIENQSYYGELDLLESRDGLLQIENAKYPDRIKAGMKLRLSEQRSAISRIRREKALQKIIDNESVIPNIYNYFEDNHVNSGQVAETIDIPEPSEELFAAYNLDHSKKHAFKYILKRAMNVIMGPPGTGKTTLLAYLLDYVFRTQEIKSVLLLSQSNAAVNEVVIKYREVIRKINEEYEQFSVTEPSMIRLGDISSIPESLRDLHVYNIVGKIRTKFFREYDNRIKILVSSLNLPPEFIAESVRFFRNTGDIIITLEERNKRAKNTSEENNNKIHAILDKHLFSLDIDYDKSLFQGQSILLEILKLIANKYSITNMKTLGKFQKILVITNDWYQRLSSDTENFSGFLSKSRQLVIGTLVGIGKSSYNIDENQYDLVIVDEAARASASELSLAFQSARRVLLVGDHKQLPPLYDQEVIENVSKQLEISFEEVVKTDFERVFNNVQGVMLDTQYRMAPAIGRLVSNIFYNGALKTGRGSSPEWIKNLSANWEKEVTWIDTKNMPRQESRGSLQGISNKCEAEISIQLLNEIMNSSFLEKFEEWYSSDGKVPPIGLITGYLQQKNLLDEMLQKQSWYNSYQHLIRVDTIDAYQGQESRVLMLNLVRSNEEGKIGFLSIESRINVALSRAKERLIIIGDTNHWKNEHQQNSPMHRCLLEIEKMSLDKETEYKVIDFIDINSDRGV